MKFLASGDLGNGRPLGMLLWFYLLFVFLYWAGAFVHFHGKFGFSPEGVARHFFGDPAFPETLSLTQLTEDTHVQVAVIGLLLLTLSSVVLGTKRSQGFKIFVVAFSFLSGMLEVLAGYIVYLLGSDFAAVKLLSFSLFQVALLLMILVISSHLMEKNNARDNLSGPGGISLVVLLFAVSCLLFLILNAALFLLKIGGTPDDIVRHYLGDPARFTRPRTFSGMSEIALAHFLSMALYLFAIVHLLFSVGFRWKVQLGALVLVAALADILSGFLVRFFTPAFSYLKWLSFWLLEVSLFAAAFILTVSAARAYAQRRSLFIMPDRRPAYSRSGMRRG